MNSEEQILLTVDDKNNFLGYAPRTECHTGKGRRHRAFVTLLFDQDNKVLLQKRKHRLFDNLWDLTAISHPLHLTDRDESYQEASDRAMKKEMGVPHVDIKNVGAFNYFAKDGPNCENEYCVILIGRYNGKFYPSPDEVYEVKKIDYQNFLKEVTEKPELYTPWAISAVKELEKIDIKKVEMKAFQDELQFFLVKYIPYSQRFYTSKLKATSKYPDLITNFYSSLRDFSEGGKKLRAFLVYIGYLAGGGKDVSNILPISLAAEIVHNFFLIHDDIIDKSEIRRGRSTIHKSFGEKYGQHYGQSMGILVGDLALIEAYILINDSDFDDNIKIKVQKSLLMVLLETMYGEGLDVEYSVGHPTLKNIMLVADLKTAKYSIVAPLTIGAMFAKAGSMQLKALRDFGLNAGIAFQLQDDFLGLFGDEKTIGKSTLSDMREGKNTLLIHKTRQFIDKKGNSRMDEIWGNAKSGRKDLEVVQQFVNTSGALDWCTKEKARLVSNARAVVPQITKDKRLRAIFIDVCDYIEDREK